MKKFDELDKLFQSRLQKEDLDPQGTGWNEPPAGLFDAAFETIENSPSSKDRRPLLWLLIPIIGFSTLGFIYFTKANEIDEIRTEVAEMKNQVASLTEGNMANKDLTEQASKTSTQTKEKSLKTVETTALSQNQSTEYQPSLISTNTGQQSTSKNIGPQQNNRNIQKLGADNIVPPNQGMVTYMQSTNLNQAKSSVLDVKRKNISEVDRIYNSGFVLFENKAREYDLEVIETKNKNASNYNISFYGSAGIILSSITMKSPEGLSPELTKYDRWYPGFKASIGSQLSLGNKFYLDKSIQYQRLHNRSEFVSSVSYDESKEDIDFLGQDVYQDELIMASTLGSFTREVTFALDGMDMETGDMMKNETDIHQTFDVMGASVGFGYHILQRERWNVSAELYSTVQYIFNYDQKSEVRLYAKSEMLAEELFSIQESEMMKPWFSTGGLGLRAQYNLTERSFISLRGGYEHSFGSFKKSMQESPETSYLNGVNIGLQLGYKFQ